MLKSIRLIIVLIIYGLVLTGCSGGEKEGYGTGPAQGHKLKVVASIYPVYDFTKNIGGDKINLSCLVPPGGEPHEWEPSPKDMVDLQKTDVFVYCGAGMEKWVAKALETLNKPATVKIDAGKNIELLAGHDHHPVGDPEPHGAVGIHEHGDNNTVRDDNPAGEDRAGHSTNNGTVDPHIWVDPLNAIVMVDNITAGLVEADPANKDYYERNAEDYRQQLIALHEDYQKSLSGARGKEFVTSHDAFGYLAKRYGLVQVPLRGLSPEVEPTPARMVEVVNLIREKGIRYIFFESLVSPKVSEVIAAETGAEILVLNPVGGLTSEEMAAGKDYISVMRENLANLQKSFDDKL